LPNQYRRYEAKHQEVDEEEERLRAEEWERDGGDRRFNDGGGRLGGYGDEDAGRQGNDGGIVYKGRGAMKFKEKGRW